MSQIKVFSSTVKNTPFSDLYVLVGVLHFHEKNDVSERWKKQKNDAALCLLWTEHVAFYCSGRYCVFPTRTNKPVACSLYFKFRKDMTEQSPQFYLLIFIYCNIAMLLFIDCNYFLWSPCHPSTIPPLHVGESALNKHSADLWLKNVNVFYVPPPDGHFLVSGQQIILRENIFGR